MRKSVCINDCGGLSGHLLLYQACKGTDAVCNDYIPIMMVVLGMALSVGMSLLAGDAITVQSVTAGAVTGLVSTGLHQVFKGIINQTKEKENGK